MSHRPDLPSGSQLARTIARYGCVALVCIDEPGCTEPDHRGVELLFPVLAEREQRNSVAIASTQSVDGAGTVARPVNVVGPRVEESLISWIEFLGACRLSSPPFPAPDGALDHMDRRGAPARSVPLQPDRDGPGTGRLMNHHHRLSDRVPEQRDHRLPHPAARPALVHARDGTITGGDDHPAQDMDVDTSL